PVVPAVHARPDAAAEGAAHRRLQRHHARGGRAHQGLGGADLQGPAEGRGAMIMATRAERFLSEAQRGKRHEPKRRVHSRRRDTPDKGARNLSRRGEKKAAVVAEATRGRVSRKSSRTSTNRGKNSTTLEYAARLKSFSPQSRHDRR